MIKQLQISNYALIDSLDIEFQPGLNIITGETGAGKSIMLGALSMLLGARGDNRSIKRNDKKSVIECLFTADSNLPLKKYFKDNDIEWDDCGIILRREISPSGRSRAFVNDTPVSLSALREVSMHLVDIHSQQQNQLLTQPRFQLEVIDALADNQPLLAEYHEKFELLRKAISDLKSARNRLKKNAENADFMRFRLASIEKVNPVDGEYEELTQRHSQLADAVREKSSLTAAIDILTSPEQGVIDSIYHSVDLIESTNGSERMASLTERLRTVATDIDDVADSLRHIASEIEAAPEDLDWAEQRMTRLKNLLDRMGVSSTAELISLREQLNHDLSELDDSPSIVRDLENKARQVMKEARDAAAVISQRRRQAAEIFARRLKEEATPLGMKNLQCEIRVSDAEISSTGIDNVDFLFAFNKNQPLMPVGESASGGELSRLMLCLKAIIADRMSLPSILFDEIDTGVSGETAARMGAMMRRISVDIQTIVITHLPQVAAAGQHHFKVYKEDDDNATHTHINRLDRDERIAELATMLGGDTASAAAYENARTLLESYGN